MAITFVEYAKQKFGGSFVVARMTVKNLRRYRNHVFITQKQFQAVKDSFWKEYPREARRYFGV